MKSFKPYDFALVEMRGQNVELGVYRFVGQVLSLPTTEQTIMVRTVPGLPGSLIEVPLSSLKRLTSKPKKVQYCVVKGDGTFPTDMLRYDSCCPVNFQLIPGDYGSKVEMLPGFEGQPLMVAKACLPSLSKYWTPERWASFGWAIKLHATEVITS
jgi:hypothetical protein